MNLKDWIAQARKLGASDLHLEAGTAVVVRVRGELQSIAEPVPAAALTQWARELLNAESWDEFLARGSADVSLMLGSTRCRINLYRTLRGIAVATRLLTPSVNDLRACNLHPDLKVLTEATAGLVVVAGPTGSGKSTTLAALVEELNGTRARHILTLESPLEYLYSNRRSLIRQREIPTHSPSYEQAIVDALRENPDVLVIGEMRTPEVIRLTLNAAETGHLVLTTMHSATCAEALYRISMSFPAEIQGSIRAQLADALVGVVCQRLDFLEAHQLRVPRCEVLLANSAARGTIRSGQFSQLTTVIQSGGESGMWSFDRYQRWMEQQTTWRRPPAVSESSEVEAVHVSASVPAASARPAPKPAPAPSMPDELVIGEDLDLSEIAELAKSIERRTP